jgi:hypothetical protein
MMSIIYDTNLPTKILPHVFERDTKPFNYVIRAAQNYYQYYALVLAKKKHNINGKTK